MTLLSGLFPESVLTEETFSFPDIAALLPAERESVRGAIERRQREFAAGRVCARSALERLGVCNYTLLPGPDREPLWPEDVVGSISHTEAYCGVAVARRCEQAGIGLDVERLEGLDEDLLRIICRDEERAWLESEPADERSQLGKLFFSAKEAFFKCQFPATRALLNFKDVAVEFDRAGAMFRVVAVEWPGGRDIDVCRVEGRFKVEAGLILTGCALPA